MPETLHHPRSETVPPPGTLSRRRAVWRAFAATLGLTAASAIGSRDQTLPNPPATFVPENDYPLFTSDR